MKRFRNRYLLAVDAVLLAVLPFLVYALRFESFRWQPQDTRTAIVFGVVMLPLEIGILLGFGLYRRLWRFASIWELKLIFAAGVAASLVAWAVGGSVLPMLGLTVVRVPLSVLAMYSVLSIAIVATPRLLLRVTSKRYPQRRATDGDRRVLIAGAGSAGEMVVKEIHANPQLGLTPVGFVDDDHSKLGLRLGNLQVMGSIGAELCRQLVALEPKNLILLGHGENPIFETLHELLSDEPRPNLIPIIADIRDRHRIQRIFAQHKPYAVFHAAAHKHVPLMEENVSEAITNNV